MTKQARRSKIGVPDCWLYDRLELRQCNRSNRLLKGPLPSLDYIVTLLRSFQNIQNTNDVEKFVCRFPHSFVTLQNTRRYPTTHLMQPVEIRFS